MLELIKSIVNFFLKLLGLYNPKIEGEDVIDQKIEELNDKIEEIDNEDYDADKLADAINNDK